MANSQEAKMSQGTRKIRFGLWYDFRNPAQWRQPADRLYREILDQIAWGENNGFDDVWLSEHHFIEDGYLPSILPIAAAIAARTNRIRIASGVLLMPFHNPIRLAEDVAVVDVISGGRFELGVGIGFKREEFRASACLLRSAARAPTNRSKLSAAFFQARPSLSRATFSTFRTSR
jgi:alkanesulfonate monooxygenase SsuD/methylene tetrahydromethanopterin reductase-like flavin-dependent oxidoreductase (luciferase family)